MKLFEQTYRVNTLIVNSSGRLGLYALLNILQDCAWEHAHQIGHGHGQTLEKNLFWVLTRQKVKMLKWPKWGESLTVQSWIRTPESGIVRDFRLLDQSGQIIGEATTGWLLLDAQSRKPTKVPLDTIIQKEFMAQDRVSIDPIKIMSQGEFKELARFRVRNSDIDINQHVNNTRYAQWVLDAIPLAAHKQYLVKEYEVNFLSETKLLDEVVIEQTDHEDLAIEKRLTQSFFRGLRSTDGKIVFLVRIESEVL